MKVKELIETLQKEFDPECEVALKVDGYYYSPFPTFTIETGDSTYVMDMNVGIAVFMK